MSGAQARLTPTANTSAPEQRSEAAAGASAWRAAAGGDPGYRARHADDALGESVASAWSGVWSDFPPTVEAAWARLRAVDPAAYARTRNHLHGAVSRLSPYLTHGLLPLHEAVQWLWRQHRLSCRDKLVQELGWRQYFRHVWQRRGEGILRSLHAGPLPDAAYATELPADLRAGATGVPAIDRAVRKLYATGYLHNHSRLWLAAYVVHVRKVHWRAGADWLYTHLLDGDLASNHLSWQWVAGTGSHKPYLANADNIARFAPRAWHSLGTAFDRSYSALQALARLPQALPAEPGEHAAVDEPALLAAPPEPLPAPDPAQVSGREVWLVHPWSLADPPAGCTPIAVLPADFHAHWPWSARRWAFVLARLRALAVPVWFAPAAQLAAALRGARRVLGIDDPHLPPPLRALGLAAPHPPWPEPDRLCPSFSAYWAAVCPRP